MRLYVALVNRARAKLALYHHVGLPKALFHIAQRVLLVGCDIRAARRVIAHRRGGHVGMQDGRVGFHSVFHVGDGGQDFVPDVNERQRLFGGVGAGGGDGGDGMAFVERLVRRQEVVARVLQVGIYILAHLGRLVRQLREIRGGSHRQDFGMRRRLACINGADNGVSVWAAKNLAEHHSRQIHIRAVERLARYLVIAVVPDWASANDFVWRFRFGCHSSSAAPRLRCACAVCVACDCVKFIKTQISLATFTGKSGCGGAC